MNDVMDRTEVHSKQALHAKTKSPHQNQQRADDVQNVFGHIIPFQFQRCPLFVKTPLSDVDYQALVVPRQAKRPASESGQTSSVSNCPCGAFCKQAEVGDAVCPSACGS